MQEHSDKQMGANRARYTQEHQFIHFTWGRSKAHRVRALANDVVDRIEEAAK
ncbi:hypothetical protein [Sphaerisporangium corydalis]|uniref:Uncharacterized protein n=1 Tax=Sphaerisporangium corydalis TaxID=1441875 RepID=A0ABV9E4T1_9ACTN|nr:hypothetical protein [Sphaerisporangium corydalis]